jgi:formylglycine-generating enzyme required for sulfatase activity
MSMDVEGAPRRPRLLGRVGPAEVLIAVGGAILAVSGIGTLWRPVVNALRGNSGGEEKRSEAVPPQAEVQAKSVRLQELRDRPAAKEVEPPAGLKAGTTRTIDLPGGVKLELASIPPGTFVMGDRQGFGNEKPEHEVRLTNPFWIGVTPVTQGQWKAVMGKNPSKYFIGDRHPVVNVSWDDCQQFLAKLNVTCKHQLGDLVFDLPTEAQWEYACRAGTQTRYFFGNDPGDLGDHAWFWDNSGRQVHPVGERKPNAWGLLDMNGNVWQWCQDQFGPYGGDATDPNGPATGNTRCLRGGRWCVSADYCRSASRNWGDPALSLALDGCRVVLR